MGVHAGGGGRAAGSMGLLTPCFKKVVFGLFWGFYLPIWVFWTLFRIFAPPPQWKK